MGHRPAHVPQFGNWEGNDEVPFTVIFDNARAGKGEGRKFNPNDPLDNPAAFGLTPSHGSGLEDDNDGQHAKLRPVTKADLRARQEGDWHDNLKMDGANPSKRAPTTSNAKDNTSAADGARKGSTAISTRDNMAPEGFPNQQMYEGRPGNRPGSPYQNSSDTGRSRLQGSSRPDGMPDKSAALPKFGVWDENDPSAGDGYTVIFNQHRNEKKQGGPVQIPSLQGDQPSKLNQRDGYKQTQDPQRHKKSSFWRCCWGHWRWSRH